MKKLLDEAYAAVLDSLHKFADFLAEIGGYAVEFFVYATIPLWFIPFAIYKKVKRGKSSGETEKTGERIEK